MDDLDAIAEIHQQYPTPQDRVRAILLFFGVTDVDKVKYCDTEMCQVFLASLAISDETAKFVTYMRM